MVTVRQPPTAKAATRDRLLAHALDLIREGGPDAASARAICERAGVRAPSLYHHFGDLSGLHRAIVDAVFAESLREKTAGTLSDPAAEIARGWDSYVAFAIEEPRLFAMVNAAVVSPEMPGPARASLERLTDLFAGAPCRAGLDAGTAARIAWASAHGAASLAASAALRGEVMGEDVYAGLRDATLRDLFDDR